MPARFPHAPMIDVRGRSLSAAEVIDRLSPYISENRRQRIEDVVAARTYAVVPVLAGMHDTGNVNAVMRSAEGLGYGSAHLAALEGEARAVIGGGDAPVSRGGGLGTARRQSQGADKWMDLVLWEDVVDCLAALRTMGYRIAATHLAADAVPVAEVDFTIPTAVIFGNEAEGVSEHILARADLNCVLPIQGFIQSYNVSVAAALTLYHARQDRISRQGHHGDLTLEEQNILTAVYFLRGVKNAEALLAA